jgi:hypothetical protein
MDPADMREVKVEVYIEGGEPMARAVPDVAAVPGVKRQRPPDVLMTAVGRAVP